MPITLITNRDLLAYLTTISAQVTLLTQEVHALTEEIKIMAVDISKLEEAFVAQQEELARLTTEVSESNAAISALRQEIEELQEMVADLEAGDTISQEQIDQLTEKINAANAIIAEASGGLDTGQQAAAPVLISISPTSAVIGAADVVLQCVGDNFTPESVIVFNDGEERTDYVDGEHLSTIVKPSTAGTPGTYNVLVRTPGVGDSLPAPFTFTPAP